MLIALLSLMSGCASIDAFLFDSNPDEAALQSENQRLKSEAATLRQSVDEKKQTLEALKK